ncbi:glycolate oxidase iron-sulfur subunit [Asanoa ishikariensis]|uniref:Glycolate oxidase iron-sulfur subunit n=1 Tax=Asanoa ishikariensis TaxID=137265 RepID=A0A1H3TW51_9ACTN|nr:heterodisulfide reductase-related iron-sulfur binding cluster [Asanoa ishikariensis]GIF67576.1 glycolate oxidase iron-sulfur subunit [Asanoa ishikariensis]SDZ54297.1 glycolate oxidase iron-sulfur subunit [Asanoa ishikariensis]
MSDTAWDERRPPDPELIKDCVHCGFCLPTCPSYVVFENEMDSPRGRILLMRVGHEDPLSASMVEHFDRCLGCMACVTACPSGVQYDRLIEQVRPQIERSPLRSRSERLHRAAIFALFTHPARLRAMVPAIAAQGRLGLARMFGDRALRTRIGALLSLAPKVPVRAATQRLAMVTPAAQGVEQRGRVAFMQGCIQRVLYGDVNAATVRVLAAEGWEVHAPRKPRCCGALQLHSGLEPESLALARQTIAAYEGFDAIAVNVAGCGSAMKDYGHLLADDPAWADRAKAFSAKVRDVHELLDAYPAQATRHPVSLKLAYHDACHLAHAQGVRIPPRALLRGIPGITLVEPREWELCCGSAGIYNLLQPDAAAKLGKRKADNLADTGADAIAAANPGCALQITAHLGRDRAVPIYHPMTLLDASIRGVAP